MKKKKVSKKINCLKKMPPVPHSNQGEFSYKKSQMLKWILEQDEVLDWLCQYVFNSGYVKYDSDAKKWQGVDYHD